MSTPAIRIQNLTKDFAVGMRGMKLRAVEDLCLEVGDNEIFGLLGPNGSGKSTTIKIILGLLEASTGTCEIYGRPAVVLVSCPRHLTFIVILQGANSCATTHVFVWCRGWKSTRQWTQ